jgi:PAS domain S-box-containing protein
MERQAMVNNDTYVEEPIGLPIRSREELLVELQSLRRANAQLSLNLQRRDDYIRAKVNHLLNVMGTKPLREEELESDSILEIDPLGIIFESFRHILATLKIKNNQLHFQNDEILAIFAAAQVGIMVIDKDLRIISFNNRMKEIFFSDLEEATVLSTTCTNIACKGLISSEFCAARRVLAGNGPANFKNWEVRGRIFDVEAAPIHDDEGEIKRIVLVYNDITDLKQTQEELGILNARLEQRVIERTVQLQEANRELESFCYSVSHDLRAPLRHISGFANILSEDYRALLDEAGLEYLKRICEVSSHMGRLIDDLLRISRVARVEMKSEDVDLSKSAETAVAMFRESEPERRIVVNIAKGLQTRGDGTLLDMVIQNLIGNAWKYSSRNEEAMIEMGKTVVLGKEAFFVKDNGVGFDMTYHNKLFHVFERLHGEEFEGTGIGLATVQRIIARHSGEIWAESSIGKGATFYFTLPLCNMEV